MEHVSTGVVRSALTFSFTPRLLYFPIDIFHPG
jgi:hypothetical protein